MIGETAALALLERALAFSNAPETDLYLSGQDLALTRFAGNAIHQNVAHSNVTLEPPGRGGATGGPGHHQRFVGRGDPGRDGIGAAQCVADAGGSGIPRAAGSPDGAARGKLGCRGGRLLAGATGADGVGSLPHRSRRRAGHRRRLPHRDAGNGGSQQPGRPRLPRRNFLRADRDRPQRHLGRLGQGRRPGGWIRSMPRP